MISTWIEASAKGRHGGPVRAGMWSTVVVGTHPIQANQSVWLEFSVDDRELGILPGFWLENRGVNSLWHVALPPQAVGSRIRYRAVAELGKEGRVATPYQEVVVRPNLPMKTEQIDAYQSYPEGLVGNRQMTVKVDRRGTTYDIFFPTVGLHSDARPLEGELAQSRLHFQAIEGGIAIGRRLDWFDERLAWEADQSYQGATNNLVTDLQWRHGAFRVRATDFVAMGEHLPRTAGGNIAAGQYLKRFEIFNNTGERKKILFGLFIHAEINGGFGETGLSWHDDERILVAFNRGHVHANRKLCRDSTIEFSIAFDDRGETYCEPAGPNEAILLRTIEIDPGAPARLDVLISGAFTGWSGDQGTFDHWTRPALAWFRSTDLDEVQRQSAEAWSDYIDPLPALLFPRPQYATCLQRSALAALLHCDEEFGSSASGFDRGLNAYSWPRDSVALASALDRCGHPQIGRQVFQWLGSVRNLAIQSLHAYWFQKYTIDGWAEWETPSLDQTAAIPWSLERHYRRTGDLDFVARHWKVVEVAAGVCSGRSGHPAMVMQENYSLIRSAGAWDNRFGSFLYSNAAAVAGLRAACRLATKLGRTQSVPQWEALADRILNRGILGKTKLGGSSEGLYAEDLGRFLEARGLSRMRGLWSDDPELVIDHAPGLEIPILGLSTPFGLVPASDERMRRTAEAIRNQCVLNGNKNAMALWAADSSNPHLCISPGESQQHVASSLAALWMARYLIQLGKETGEVDSWTEAVALLDDVLARLGPLGLSLNTSPSTLHGIESGRVIPRVCHLHVPLIEAMLDLAGLDFDASTGTLILEPALPPEWPEVGIEQEMPCGRVSYRLQAFAHRRPSHRINLTANLRYPVTLQVLVASPGLTELRNWHANPATGKPVLDGKRQMLSWTMRLHAGSNQCDWSWG